MANIILRFYKFLVSPFENNLTYFIIISFLASISSIVFWICQGNLIFGLYLGLHGVIMSYVICLLGEIIKNRQRNKLYRITFLILGVLNFIVDASLHLTSKVDFGPDIVAICMETNMNETKEFLSTYLTGGVILTIVAGFLIICVIYKLRAQIDTIGKKLHLPLFVIILIGAVTISIRKSENWYGVFLNKVAAFFTYEAPPDLRPYQKELSLASHRVDQPDYIVLILGESFTKSHSSLYGYKKTTNPYLSELVEDSLLFVYDNAIAPATHTIECIKSIMSTYTQEDSVNWYECATLPNIMKSIGYRTYWISNQSPTGMHNNIASRYSSLCDTSWWIGSKVQGESKTNYDGEILDALYRLRFSDNDGKNFIVIHLMGSHIKFEDRSPVDYKKYSLEDYWDFKEHQREIVASYDNSILYNDYIVSEILKYFSGEETLAFYFPDHGIDLYESSENYYGHAIQGDITSETIAKSIPLMIYCSEKYQQVFPEDMKKIKENISSKFETESMIDYLMSLLEIQGKIE